MFVIYPILGYTAAQSLHSLTRIFPRKSKLLMVSAIIPFLLLSSLRTYSLTTFYNYSAVYTHLPQTGKVCIQDWYLFPSHFFIPENVQIGFIKGDFGLVPSLYNGYSSIPDGNNDENRPIDTRFMEIEECDYVIGDLRNGFKNVYCELVLDRLETGNARWFYIGEKKWKRYCLMKRDRISN
jgi:hypothetical protein